MAETEELCENFSVLTILAKGSMFSYTVPSFNANIVEVKFQWEQIHKNKSSEMHVFDRFAKNCKDLDHPLPGTACIEFNNDCAFMIEVSEIFSYHYNLQYYNTSLQCIKRIQ